MTKAFATKNLKIFTYDFSGPTPSFAKKLWW
jgi:hypothetical protein